MLLNALDYPSVQASLDAARDGDRVYLPRTRRPYVVPPSGWVIRASIMIYGDGPTTRGTMIVPSMCDEHPNVDLFLVKPPPGLHEMTVVIADLRVVTPADGSPAAVGMQVLSEPSSRPALLRLEGVTTALKRTRRSKAASHAVKKESAC